MFVTHGADFYALVTLTVPLSEELHHDAVCPLSVELQGFGGVAEVCAVNHILKHLSKKRKNFYSLAVQIHS